MENPFAIFSCDSAQTIPLKDTDSSRNRSAPNPCNSSHISRCKAEAASPGKRRRRGDDASQSVQKKSIAGMEFMTRWWEDLRSLTSNYPFAVMITGVLGAQARDIVTVAALRRLAVRVDNDICPKKLSSFDVDSFEEIIRTVNHCRKKSKTIIDLSKIIERRTMPTTRIGLCQLPGNAECLADANCIEAISYSLQVSVLK